MGKRTGQLAGLAALGALGYMLSRDKEGAPTGARSAVPGAEAQGEADSYPDESRRGRMATRSEDVAPVRAVAPGPRAARSAGPDAFPGAAAMMENYVPRDRYTRGMDEMPVATDTANVSDAVSRRTGVALNSAAGAGRGMQGGPTAAELAAYAASRPTPARVGTGSGRGGQGGPTAEELAAYGASRRSAQNIMRDARENTRGPELVLGGAGGRGVASALNPVLQDIRALSAPTAQIAGPSAAALRDAARTARAATRQAEMAESNAANYGLNPSAPGYEAAAKAMRDRLGGNAFTVKKKGGVVKAKKMASGGVTVSSASKRADGIAQRGKTRGKLC